MIIKTNPTPVISHKFLPLSTQNSMIFTDILQETIRLELDICGINPENGHIPDSLFPGIYPCRKDKHLSLQQCVQ